MSKILIKQTNRSWITLTTVIVLVLLIQATPSFSWTNEVTLQGLGDSKAAWGDYDNDGNLDIIINGMGGGIPTTEIYRNDGAGVFSPINPSITDVGDGSVEWGDYDNDGDLDILISGCRAEYCSRFNPDEYAAIYRNDGGGVFTWISTNLPSVFDGAIKWGDYDGDGDLDAIAYGYHWTGSALLYVTDVYRNDGGQYTKINTGLPLIHRGAAAWGDYDNDGDLDLAITGCSALAGNNTCDNYISKIYRNDNGIFTDIGAPLEGVEWYSAVAWGDYDNDGDLDPAIAGLSSSGVITKVYRNDNGTFEEVASLAGVSYAAIAWGDYDNDGNLDLLVTGFDGSSSYTSVTRLYRNEAGSFVDTNLNIIGITDLGDLAWGDYDNDGKLDFLIAGGTVSGQITKIYRNDVSTANTLPSAPSGLISTFNENIATLAWSKATDNETPQNGLTYNVRIGTTPGGNDVLSSISLPSGYRLVPKPGNAGARTTLSIKVPTDRTIYWSVQAVDTAFAGSSFALEQSFFVPGPDISITQTISPSLAGQYDNVVFTLTVINNGPIGASGIRLTDYLPDNFAYVNLSGPGGCNLSSRSFSPPGWNLSCNWNSLAAGATATVAVTMKPKASGTFINTANVSCNENDPNVSNNTATATVVVDFAPPVTIATPTGGTYASAQSVTLSCNDGGGSGCASTYYCLGASCSPTTSYAGAILLNSSTSLRFYSTDASGNAESVKMENYVVTDTTPDPFTFIDQTGVPLNTVMTSNAITVTGINSPAPVSITGGSYSINGGVYTSATGTVNNGDSVSVQLTSSASYATKKSATLTIGGVSGTFSVTTMAIVYDGFFSPVDNLPLVNSAKAGQAIPVKWRLTDSNGTPISDPTSFRALGSYVINCGSLTGDPIDVIEEYGAGASGLQYAGDGYWQFNWKTPKTYAGQCRIMVLTLGDGSKYEADFKFK